MLRASANNHLSCQCFLFLTSPACTSLQCLLYTDWYQHVLCSPVSTLYNGKEIPFLFTFQTVFFYTLGSKIRWKEKEPIVRDAIEITKLVCHILIGFLHGKVCIDSLFLTLEQLWDALTYLNLLQCLFLRHAAVGEVQDTIFAFCMLLHLAEIFFSDGLLELSLWSIKADSINATILTLHKVVASRAW